MNVGDPAPDFELSDHTGTKMHLARALANGPVVLIFYVLDSTPG